MNKLLLTLGFSIMTLGLASCGGGYDDGSNATSTSAADYAEGIDLTDGEIACLKAAELPAITGTPCQYASWIEGESTLPADIISKFNIAVSAANPSATMMGSVGGTGVFSNVVLLAVGVNGPGYNVVDTAGVTCDSEGYCEGDFYMPIADQNVTNGSFYLWQ